MTLGANEILVEQTRQLFQAALTSNIVQIGIVAVFYAMFNRILDHQLLLLWCLMVTSVAAARLLLYWSFSRSKALKDVRPWLSAFTFLSAVAGMAWASFSLFYLVQKF